METPAYRACQLVNPHICDTIRICVLIWSMGPRGRQPRNSAEFAVQTFTTAWQVVAVQGREQVSTLKCNTQSIPFAGIAFLRRFCCYIRRRDANRESPAQSLAGGRPATRGGAWLAPTFGIILRSCDLSKVFGYFSVKKPPPPVRGGFLYARRCVVTLAPKLHFAPVNMLLPNSRTNVF